MTTVPRPDRAHRLVRHLALPSLLALLLASQAVASAAALSGTYPDQSLGNRGVNIKALQHLLRHHGAAIDVDGVFAASTVDAVKAFQTARGLTANGRADRATWVALRVPVANGATGDAVLALQRLLIEKRRADLALTGTFDEPTRLAVRAFQRHARLTVRNAADATTWRALLAHLELPVWARSLCDYSVGNGRANWGTSAAIGQLQAAAVKVAQAGHGRVALGDIGYEHGGDIAGHQSHEQGLDVDIRPMRDAKDQCRWGVNYRWSTYDRAATRALVKAIRAAAPGHVKLIYFNDPVLIREGLVRWYPGHDDHLHIRYCEKVHPVAAYDC
ncbi:MAG: penicillin-insensitive murein endopeptidase [Candidatus Limnocylindrales bacterium]